MLIILCQLIQDPEESKVATELAALEVQVRDTRHSTYTQCSKLGSCAVPLPPVQLSGVEKFALRFVETQNAAKHAEQLRIAEVGGALPDGWVYPHVLALPAFTHMRK